jgi:hydroxyacylglutathione hydrolase
MAEEPLIFQGDLHVERILNEPVSSNCFIVLRSCEKDCLIIDPGSEDTTTIVSYLTQNDLVPSHVILTHEHFDHSWGVIGLSKYYSFSLLCSQVCANAIINPKKNLSIFYDQVGFTILNRVTTVEALGFQFDWNQCKLFFIKTPGHTESSISVKISNLLFCGDLLIQNEKTVTKLPGGSANKLSQTLKRLKAALPPDTLVYSGHGECFLFKDYFLYKEI